MMVTVVPSFRTDVADGLSVSEDVGPAPPLEPAQAHRPASAAAAAARVAVRSKVTGPPTRARRAGVVRQGTLTAAPGTGQNFRKCSQICTGRPQRRMVRACVELAC